jgi:hypothetical protein
MSKASRDIARQEGRRWKAAEAPVPKLSRGERRANRQAGRHTDQANRNLGKKGR